MGKHNCVNNGNSPCQAQGQDPISGPAETLRQLRSSLKVKTHNCVRSKMHAFHSSFVVFSCPDGVFPSENWSNISMSRSLDPDPAQTQCLSRFESKHNSHNCNFQIRLLLYNWLCLVTPLLPIRSACISCTFPFINSRRNFFSKQKSTSDNSYTIMTFCINDT